MLKRSPTLRWRLTHALALGVVVAIACWGGASLLSAPRKPNVPPTIVMVDANGNPVGTVASVAGLVPIVIISTSAGPVALDVFSDHLWGTDARDLLFPLPECSGTPYFLFSQVNPDLPQAPLSLGHVFVDQILYVSTTHAPQNLTMLSYKHRDTGVCYEQNFGIVGVVPVTPVGNIYEQYPPPYSLQLR